MVTAAPEPTTEQQSAPVGEQRVVIRGVSWDAYLQILHALPQARASRLTYDDGVLEITMPLEDHEFSGRLIERFILTLVELFGMRLKTSSTPALECRSFGDLMEKFGGFINCRTGSMSK